MQKTKRKKSLVGWTHKGWTLHWDYIKGFGQGICHCEILKDKDDLSSIDKPRAVRITIEEIT